MMRDRHYRAKRFELQRADAEHEDMMRWIAKQMGVSRANVRAALLAQPRGKRVNWVALYAQEKGKLTPEGAN